MAHPYETNHEEACDVGQVGRPKIGHCPEQMPARTGSDRQIEHKQRDRDREDAVAECLESRTWTGRCRLPRVGRVQLGASGTCRPWIAEYGGRFRAITGSRVGPRVSTRRWTAPAVRTARLRRDRCGAASDFDQRERVSCGRSSGGNEASISQRRSGPWTEDDVELQPHPIVDHQPARRERCIPVRPNARRLSTPFERIRRSPFSATRDAGASACSSSGRDTPHIVIVPRTTGTSPGCIALEIALRAIVGCRSASKKSSAHNRASRRLSPV